MNRTLFLASCAIGAVFAFSVFTGSFYEVGQGERGVITHYGAVVGLAQPGLGFKTPFLTGITHVNIQQQQLNFDGTQTGNPKMQAYSRDQQPATIVLAVNWHVVDPTAIFTTYGTNEAFAYRVVASKALEQFKNTFGQFDAADAIQQRAKLNAEVTAALQLATRGQPGIIDSVQIEDISFSNQYEQAVEARMQAIVKQQQAEAEKSQRMTNADAAKYEKEANADATLYAAQAEAKGIQAKGDALRASPEVVSLTVAQKWDGVLPTTMVPGSAVPFLDVNHK